MTLIAESPVVVTREASRAVRPAQSRVVADVAVVLALLVLLIPVTHAGGGRDPGVLVWAALALLPALAFVRPWRLPRSTLGLALGPGVGALLSCFFSATAWQGARVPAALLLAGVLFLVLKAWLTCERRRRLLVGVVLVVGVDQFWQSFLPWWAASDASTQMLGTFYWHNQYAAFSLGLAIMAGGAVAVLKRSWAFLGGVAAALSMVGIVLSTSRATLALLVVAWPMLIIVTWRRSTPRRRWCLLLVPLVAFGLTTLATGPLVVAEAGGAGSALAAREAAQPVEGNGQARLVFWAAAWEVFLDAPVAGAGHGSFGAASSPHMPARAGRGASVHNGPLQLLAEGGVVTGAPVLLLLGVGLAGAWRRRSADPLTVAAVVASGALVAHALVDFDWNYPALLGLLAVSVALAGGVSPPPTYPRRQPGAQLALIALLLVSAGLTWRVAEARDPNPEPAGGLAGVLTGSTGPLRDPSYDVALLATADRGDRDAVRRAVDRLERLGSQNAAVQWQRLRALVDVGERGAAVTAARRTWEQRRAHQPLQVVGYAGVLEAAGLEAEARRAVDVEIAAAIAARDQGGVVFLLRERLRMADDHSARCLGAAAGELLPAGALPELAPPSLPCRLMESRT